MTGKDFANPLRKTHSLTFESKQLFYPWHRWHRLELLTRKGTGPHSEHSLWCRLPEDPPDAAMVAIPLWMFDAAVCATMRLGDQPSVDCAALRALQDLIGELRAGGPREVLQHQQSQPENGDTDANDKAASISNRSARAVLRAKAPAAVERPSRATARRGDPKPGAAAAQRSRRKSRKPTLRSSKSRRSQ